MKKDVLGFEGLYQITDTGIVIALERKVAMPKGGHKIIKEHRPKLSTTVKGYLKVMLTNNEGIRKGFFVHRLVAFSFIGYSPLQVNHKDLNKQNNNISNLEFVTNRQNAIHAFDKTKTHSRYTGVTKNRNHWQSQIQIDGKYMYLGYFKTEIDAHKKYLEVYNQWLSKIKS